MQKNAEERDSGDDMEKVTPSNTGLWGSLAVLHIHDLLSECMIGLGKPIRPAF
jgi:hypothetical protein